MPREQRSRQSTKAGDQNHSVSEQVSPAHRRVAGCPTPFDVNRHHRVLVSGITVATNLSRISPGKLFEVPRDVTSKSANVERHRKCNRVSCLGGHAQFLGIRRDAIER